MRRARANPAASRLRASVDRGLIAEAPGGSALVAEMDHPAKERAGGEDDGAAGDCAAVDELDSGDRARLGQDARRFAFDDGKIRGLGNQILHSAPIELPVRLGAGALDSRTLAAVEDAKLDAGLVGGARHHAIERVDLAHQVSLAKAADRRVAGHLADGRDTMGHERGRGA